MNKCRKNSNIPTEETQIMVRLMAKKVGLLIDNSKDSAMAAALQVSGELDHGKIINL